MHSKVDAESKPTAAPKRHASSSMRAKTSASRRSAAASALPPAPSARASSAARPSSVSDTSSNFCSCICTEQSRPPSDTHQSALPSNWISKCRVFSMLSSSSTFLSSPGPVAFTSERISRSISPAERSAALAGRMRWPLPPPPPMALRRMRHPGLASRSEATSTATRSHSASSENSSTLRARAASSKASASAGRSSRCRFQTAAPMPKRCRLAKARSAARSAWRASSVRRVRSSTPGVTDTPSARATRLASSLKPACRTVPAPGPMKRSPACAKASGKAGSSAMKP